ncbi:MAG: ThiF family adenylyltransferase [Desulfobulbaceae bacterium]|nr:ThiF family adenylyltransferase [Desulfobulbaceae bacterium]
MFQKLVNHNDDIRRLVEKGYAIAFDSNYMVIRDISYLDANRQLQIGAIVTKLVFIDQERVTLHNHQVYFAGDLPCDINGAPIPNLGDNPAKLPLSDACPDVVVNRIFSNKPKPGGKFKPFNDFYEKIESYVTIISGPAMELHSDTASPYTYNAVKEMTNSESVFKIHDTLTSRAEITDLSVKLENDIVAVIGLGGTGAYVLDFLVKSPVREIRAFDLDPFHVHNAFRSPGRLDEAEFGKPKAEVYFSRYENFRNGLSAGAKLIDASSETDLNGVTFAFVCVDNGSSRAEIFDLLFSKGIPFIDVGMGLHRKRGPLSGQIRSTYYSVEQCKTLRDKGLSPLTDGQDNLYKTNIQIGELNALNACFAVIRYKQLREFYFEETPYHHLVLEIGDFHMFRESEVDET